MARNFRYIAPIHRRKATGLVKEVYDQILEDFGLLAEPFTLHSPSPKVLAGQWAIVRETLVAGRRPRGVKEAIAATVSRANRCPWCEDSHVTMLHATGYYNNRHPALQTTVDWALVSGRADCPTAPFAAEDAPELIGVALAFHYLNRMVTVFLDERFLPENPILRGAAQRLGGLLFARRARAEHPMGASLHFLPGGPLPAELAWMRISPAVAEAFERMHRALEEETAGLMSRAAKASLEEHIRAWHGEPKPMSRRWVEQELEQLPALERAVGQLALLTALAPHQVSPSTVESFRKVHGSDEALIAVAAWGAFAAVRRIGSWLGRGVRRSRFTTRHRPTLP